MSCSHLQSLLNFQLIKFEQTQVLLRSRQDRKLYQYREDIATPLSNNQFNDSRIISPIPLEVGALLECGYMNVKQLLDKKPEKTHQHYGQQEIVNTLSPVLQALQSIHASNQVHGSLSAQAVFINNLGDVKLFYPAPLKTVPFYYCQSSSTKKDQDFRALAILAIQLMDPTLSSCSDLLSCLRKIASSRKGEFSIHFILSIFFMLTQNSQYLLFAINGFINPEESFNPEIMQLYQSFFLGKTRKTQPSFRHTDKTQFTPPLVKHSHQQLSPRKVLQMTRKLLKVQDLENKKIGDENKKKKPSDTNALKKMSNCKVEGDNTTSPTYKKILRDLRETKQRQDLFKAAVTVKRMRTISKKKIN